MLQRTKKRCFALLVSLCLLASGALSQTTVTGRLLDDADGKPVTSGIVRLLDSLSKTVDFTYTQADGRFKLELTSSGRYTLSLEAMGYAAATREVEVKPGEVQFLPLGDVRLLSSETAIQEVRVAIDKPIARKGDTLSYNAAIFRKGDEKTLEDLMKRLPGLEVNHDGKVQYQGKEIEKIMVSGQDLMGRGYQMLTRNLDAKSVKKVDVLEHYQDERLLRNVEQSEKVALNLQLEGDAHAWMGVLKGAYGFPHAYEANVNLTYLTSSQQWMVLGNSNRVGYHPLKDVTTLEESGLGALGSSAGDYDGVLSGVHSGVVASLDAGGAPLSDARSRWNLSHMVGVNGVVKPQESLQLRLNAAFMQEADTFAQRQQSHYQIDALTFDRFSESEQMERLRLGMARLDVKWSPTFSAELRYNGGYSYTGNRDAGSVLERNEYMLERLMGHNHYTDHTLSYTQSLGDYGVLRSGLEYRYGQREEQYGTSHPFFVPVDSSGAFAQRTNQQEQYGRARLVYSSPIFRGFSLRADAGVVWLDQALFLRPSGPSLPPEYAEDKLLHATFYDGQLGLGATYSHGITKSYIGANGHYLQGAFSGTLTDAVRHFYPEVYAAFKVDTYRHRATLSYGLNMTGTSLQRLVPGWTVTGYSRLRRGDTPYQLYVGHSVLGLYSLGNWVSNVFLQFVAFYNVTPRASVSALLQAPRQTVEGVDSLRRRNDLLSLQFTGDFFILPIRCNLKSRLIFNRTAYSQRVNLELEDAQQYGYRGDLSLKSSLGWIMDFEVGGSVQFADLRGAQRYQSLENTQYLDLFFNFTRDISLRVSGDRQQTRREGQNSEIYFLDAEFQYVFPKPGLTLYLQGSNLLFHREFAQHMLAPTLERWVRYDIAPLRVLLGLIWRF